MASRMNLISRSVLVSSPDIHLHFGFLHDNIDLH